jgi:transcriptional regulator with XRE-family HTH domain
MAGADWRRLGATVVDRRVRLGHRSRTAFADSCGISLRTLGDIETGRRAGYRPSTLATLEQALDWRVGTALRVVAGEPAEPLDAEPDIPITFVWI